MTLRQNSYCRTAYGDRIHIARWWRGEWLTWCGQTLFGLQTEEVKESQVCKYCLKKYRGHDAPNQP